MLRTVKLHACTFGNLTTNSSDSLANDTQRCRAKLSDNLVYCVRIYAARAGTSRQQNEFTPGLSACGGDSRNQTMGNRIAHQLGIVVKIHFLHEARLVGTDGLVADGKFICDRIDALAPDEQTQNVELAI